MKPYRLLRNNRESGPYSADELIQLGLKAYDLVWVEGKSASWRYPSEIPEFKPYAPIVEEQPFDRFFKRPPATGSPVTEDPTVANTIPSITVKPPKPRIRIKADTHKIDTTVRPGQYDNHLTSTGLTLNYQPEPELKQTRKETVGSPVNTNPDWRDVWLDWEQEKKAVSEAGKVNVRATMHSVDKLHSSVNENYASIVGKSDCLETKFSQSLDDIKEQYIETVLKQSRKGKSSPQNNYATVAILIAAILGIGIWLGLKWSGPSNTRLSNISSNTAAKGPAQTAEIKTDPTNDTQVTAALDELAKVPDNESGNQEVKKATQMPGSKSTAYKPQRKTVKSANSRSGISTGIKINTINPLTNNQPIDNESNQKTVANKNTGSFPVADAHETAIAKFKNTNPKISDYISVNTYSSSGNATGVKLKVQNLSDITVDLVMIDLSYYDENGRFEKGETMYLRDIGAGETVSLPAPDNPQATKVNCKVSMVSSEKNNLYLIAD